MLSLENISKLVDDILTYNQEVTLLVCFSGTVSNSWFSEYVGVSKVTAFNVGNEWYEVRINFSLDHLSVIVLFEHFVSFFHGQEFVNIDLELYLTLLDEVDFFCMIFFLVENISNK